MVYPLLVLQDGKNQKDKGDVVARMIIARLAKIDAVLTTELSSQVQDRRYFTDGVIPPQFDREHKVAQPIDIEFRAFDVDIVGLFNSLHKRLYTGDRLHGTVTLSKDNAELMMVMEAANTKNTQGPWHVTGGPNDLQSLIDKVSHQIAFDFHKETNPHLKGLTYEQFHKFVEALRSYQGFALLADGDDQTTEALRYLTDATKLFTKLADQSPECSLVYSYLASTLTLSGTSGLEKIVSLWERALEIDVANTFAQSNLNELRRIQDQAPIALERNLALNEIRSQSTFVKFGLNEIDVGARKVKVAILSTGVDRSVDELNDRVVHETSFVPGETPTDYYGNGTAVTSIIAAIAPNAEILSVKVISDRGFGRRSWILAGLNWAMNNNAEVVFTPLASSRSATAVQRLYQSARNAGIIVVSIAGNMASEEPVFPGAYESVLSVGAIDLHGDRASMSSFGDWVTIFAPGIEIETLGPNGWTQKRQGTPYSAAIVAGVVAVIKSINSDLSPDQTTDILRKTADKVSDNQLNLNAVKAIDAVKKMQ